ncbi:UDP-4-amino-4,6-dideoxy-N-acetyl-beta-L-altrosamine transaminase [Thalassospira sp.]|uniref:UDP-4-amino-4, 6-dideoxy-N-acetyl-beta-L-altrosamine transaminase n=1 Tax=Thalassospira sp. TaxID=1912094 RepID=UPI0032EF15CC
MIPYGRHHIDNDDIEAVIAALKSDSLTGGACVGRFEEDLARFTSSRNAVVCNSGTAALHLALMALDIGAGDIIVVPSLTFLATANAGIYVGADIKFADVDPETGLLTSETLNAALRELPAERVKAVLPVHLNGAMSDVRSTSLPSGMGHVAIVEDACHAIGGAYSGSDILVGSAPWAAMTCFSFHPVKTIAMGEGGAITTEFDDLAERLRLLRNHGMERDAARFVMPDQGVDSVGKPFPWFYEMATVGYNYRASDLHCALGTSQLKKAPGFLARRRELACRYNDLIGELAPIVKPVPRSAPDGDGWHLFSVHIDFHAVGKPREQVMQELRERGIGSQVHYLPVHRQPFYQQKYGKQHLPGADSYYQKQLSLPLFPAMEDTDVDRVLEALAQVLNLRAVV